MPNSSVLKISGTQIALIKPSLITSNEAFKKIKVELNYFLKTGVMIILFGVVLSLIYIALESVFALFSLKAMEPMAFGLFGGLLLVITSFLLIFQA